MDSNLATGIGMYSFVVIASLISIWFVVKKVDEEKYNDKNRFLYHVKVLPFVPLRINYWIFKIGIIVGGLLAILAVIIGEILGILMNDKFSNIFFAFTVVGVCLGCIFLGANMTSSKQNQKWAKNLMKNPQTSSFLGTRVFLIVGGLIGIWGMWEWLEYLLFGN